MRTTFVTLSLIGGLASAFDLDLNGYEFDWAKDILGDYSFKNSKNTYKPKTTGNYKPKANAPTYTADDLLNGKSFTSSSTYDLRNTYTPITTPSYKKFEYTNQNYERPSSSYGTLHSYEPYNNYIKGTFIQRI